MRHLVVCAVLGVAAIASAEPRRTTEAVTLRKKPGERQTAVATVPANTVVTILAEEGRWLKISVNGVTGYVTRTTITDVNGAVPPPETDGWSSARKGETELFIAVPTAGTLSAEPKSTSVKVADVPKGAHLVVLDTTPGWIHARDDDGHEGWIARTQVENGSTAVTMTGTGIDLQGTSEPYKRRAPRPFAARFGVGLGYRSLGMDLTSNAEGGLTNYLVDADAAAVVVDGDASRRLSGRVFAGVDIHMVLSESSPGIDYPGPTSVAGKIAFSTFGIDAGGRVGVHAHQAFDLALRAGVHYDAFVTKMIDNVGMLPRERLVGATLGARADITPPHSQFSATLRLDVLVVGSRAQTPGLEDGTSSTAHGVWGGLGVRYQLTPHVAPFVAYDFGRATTTWRGPSVREPAVTNAHRTDTTQLIQLGVSAEL